MKRWTLNWNHYYDVIARRARCANASIYARQTDKIRIEIRMKKEKNSAEGNGMPVPPFASQPLPKCVCTVYMGSETAALAIKPLLGRTRAAANIARRAGKRMRANTQPRIGIFCFACDLSMALNLKSIGTLAARRAFSQFKTVSRLLPSRVARAVTDKRFSHNSHRPKPWNLWANMHVAWALARESNAGRCGVLFTLGPIYMNTNECRSRLFPFNNSISACDGIVPGATSKASKPMRCI